jgi:hypothetical protein
VRRQGGELMSGRETLLPNYRKFTVVFRNDHLLAIIRILQSPRYQSLIRFILKLRRRYDSPGCMRIVETAFEFMSQNRSVIIDTQVLCTLRNAFLMPPANSTLLYNKQTRDLIPIMHNQNAHYSSKAILSRPALFWIQLL